MIDRSLNYGRHLIARYAAASDSVETALDIGAGNGADLALVRRAWPDAALHAVEAYPPAVEALQAQGVSVHASDIERDRLPFADNSVDLVIANQILEHVKEVFWIFHEVSRVLKPGGNFVIGVPNLAAFHNRIGLLVGLQPSQLKNNSAHVRGWTLHDMKRLMRTCFDGYELVQSGGSNFYPFPPLLAKPLAAMLPSMAWGVFMQWRLTSDYTDEFIRYPQVNRLQTNFFLGAEAADDPYATRQMPGEGDLGSMSGSPPGTL